MVLGPRGKPRTVHQNVVLMVGRICSGVVVAGSRCQVVRAGVGRRRTGWFAPTCREQWGVQAHGSRQPYIFKGNVLS